MTLSETINANMSKIAAEELRIRAQQHYEFVMANLSLHPRVIGSANVGEVMSEQLEYLIEHAAAGPCGCPRCGRFERVRAILLEPFGDREDMSLPRLILAATAGI